MVNKPHILELFPNEIKKLGLFEKKYRIVQFLKWIYQDFVIDFSKMSNIPISKRNELRSLLANDLPAIDKIEESSDGTTKFLLNLNDNNKIEMVLIPNGNKNTLCVSSQVGCIRNCKFCATATMGLIRNLEAYEIVAQIFITSQHLKKQDKKLTNIVFMGMGEPLDNYNNLIKSVKILENDEFFNFSPRKITISTSGVIPRIYDLIDSGLKIKLAVSLNAAMQDKREILMPITKTYPLAELKNALVTFKKHTPYRITFEYVMIKDFNMSYKDVKAIIAYLGDISCKLNIIPWNELSFLSYKSPSENEVEAFEKKLQNLSFAVTRRRSRGQDISAACGQLAVKSAR